MSKTISTLKRLPTALTQLLDTAPTSSGSGSGPVTGSGSGAGSAHAATWRQNQPRTLYETLAGLPRDGVGARVYQSRWGSKGIRGSFWYVTRSRMRVVRAVAEGGKEKEKEKEKGKRGGKGEGEGEAEGREEAGKKLIHGKAWGWLIWRGESDCFLVFCPLLILFYIIASHQPNESLTLIYPTYRTQLIPIHTPGKPISTKEEPIPGGLKYKWSPGISPLSSAAKPGLGLVQPVPGDRQVLEQIREMIAVGREKELKTLARRNKRKGREGEGGGEKWTWKERSAAKVEERRRVWEEAIRAAQ